MKHLGWVLALCTSMPALAQERSSLQHDRPHAWRLELRLSTAYYPYDIDKGITPFVAYQPDAAGNPQPVGPFGPFHQVFGPNHRLFVEGEVDRDLWQTVAGSFGVGAGLSYVEFYGTGFRQLGGLSYVSSGDSASFHVGQLRLLGVYRFDPFVRAGFPFVPFAKVGLDFAYYWNQLSSGDVTPNLSGTGGGGQGLVTGIEGSAGLSFLLDVVDPMIARELYIDVGIAHTFLTASWTWQNIQNGPSGLAHSIFNGGSAGPATLNLSSSFFDFGVGFEF